MLQSDSKASWKTYLGVPALWGRPKSQVLDVIKDKMIAKIKNWKLMTLSVGGKDTLIKAVLEEEEVDAIKEIQISGAGDEDRMV
ncbi:hypothetical protein J1N35_042758 [Gossypium stocksii]|uniref:Reverse transcriptase n=1 Tax=Gossypium stocksii TaxID=47602 RepID=A0A9D3U629_9ROSI|nr:hypothetical protein J1N35_042758 [Gossypium stocksii]